MRLATSISLRYAIILRQFAALSVRHGGILRCLPRLSASGYGGYSRFCHEERDMVTNITTTEHAICRMLTGYCRVVSTS